MGFQILHLKWGVLGARANHVSLPYLLFSMINITHTESNLGQYYLVANTLLLKNDFWISRYLVHPMNLGSFDYLIMCVDLAKVRGNITVRLTSCLTG